MFIDKRQIDPKILWKLGLAFWISLTALILGTVSLVLCLVG